MRTRRRVECAYLCRLHANYGVITTLAPSTRALRSHMQTTRGADTRTAHRKRSCECQSVRTLLGMQGSDLHGSPLGRQLCTLCLVFYGMCLLFLSLSSLLRPNPQRRCAPQPERCNKLKAP